jgi:hypothetical protein
MKALPLPSRLISILFVFALVSMSSFAAKKKGKKTNRGAKEQVITGKVSLKKDDTDFTKIYQIGKTSVSKSCSAKVSPFEGKTVRVTCRVHQGRILTIKSVEEVKAPAKKKK